MEIPDGHNGSIYEFYQIFPVVGKMAKLLDILLQRSDITIPWGFQIRGGHDMDCQPFISSVSIIHSRVSH